MYVREVRGESWIRILLFQESEDFSRRATSGEFETTMN